MHDNITVCISHKHLITYEESTLITSWGKLFSSRTPKFRKTVMIPTPRTPTPFKNALAAQEKMHGPLKMEVQCQTCVCVPVFLIFKCSCYGCGYISASVCVFQPQPLAFLEEDIREVLKQETGADIFNRADVQPDYRAWKHNVRVAWTHIVNTPCGYCVFWGGFTVCILALWFQMDGPARKVRKSLVLDPWGKDCLNVQLFQEQLNNAQVRNISDLLIQPLSLTIGTIAVYTTHNAFVSELSLLALLFIYSLITSYTLDWISHCRCQKKVWWQAPRWSPLSLSKRNAAALWPPRERSPHSSLCIHTASPAHGRRSSPPHTKHQNTPLCRFVRIFVVGQRRQNLMVVLKKQHDVNCFVIFHAGEWVGSSGLWEDRGPADYDRTGPSVPEPLPVVRLYLKGPCALKPSLRCAGNTTTPIQRLQPPLNPVRDNPVKTNEFYFYHMTQKCTAKDVQKKAWLLVLFVNTFLGDCPSTLLFIGLSWASFRTHTAWLREQFCTDMKKTSFFFFPCTSQ